MKCAIMQPGYLPWIGLFALIDAVDIFIFLENVQFVPRSWDSRNVIKGANGSKVYLSVPTLNKGHREKTFREIKINYGIKWQRKHLKSIDIFYSKAECKTELDAYTDIISRGHQFLVDLNIDIIVEACRKFGLKKEFMISSHMGCKSIDKTERLVEIAKKVGASTYISPFGSIEYLKEENSRKKFAQSGIDIFFQFYNHPIYSQLYGSFVSHLSFIDLVANKGHKRGIEIIRSGQTCVTMDEAIRIHEDAAR